MSFSREKMTLGQLCIKVTDGSHYSPKESLDGFPMLSVKDMTEYGFNYSACKRINDFDFEQMKINDCVPQKDDVLIAKDGSYLKHIFVVEDNKSEAILSSIAILRPNKKHLDPNFLAYYLKNPITKKYISENMVSGSAIPRIVLKDFKKIEMLIPSLGEQKKISEILSSIDSRIKTNNMINKTLEEMAQAIFKSWFVDFEPFRDGEFIESEHGFIPKGWKVTNFSQYYDYVAGYSYSGDELVSSKTALLTIKNFDRNGGLRNDGFKEINPIKKVKEEKYAKLFDVVVACTDLTQKAEIIGNPLLVTSSAEYESMIFSMDLVKILPTTEMADSCFAYQILKDQRFKGFALKYVSGTTVLHLSKKAFNEYLLPLPYDFEIIQKYVEIVRPMFEKLVEIESENNRLIKVRDSLLPKLMSGEIRVPFEGVPNAELR